MPMITDHIYFQTFLALDVLKAYNNGFYHNIITGENAQSNDYHYSALSSNLNSNNIYYRYNIGLGIFF